MGVRRKSSESSWRISGPSKGLLKHMQIKFMNFIPRVVSFGQKPKIELATQVIKLSFASMIRARGLSEVIESLEFSPFRLRIVGTAGSGKTQVTMRFCEQALERGEKPLLPSTPVFFN